MGASEHEQFLAPGSHQFPSGEPGLTGASDPVCGAGVTGCTGADGSGAGTGSTRRWILSGFRKDDARRGGVMIGGAGATRAEAIGAGVTGGAGTAGAGWDAGTTGALAGPDAVARSGWVTAFGLATTSAPAGTLAAGAVEAVPRRTCPPTAR